MYDIDDLIGAKCQVKLYNLESATPEQEDEDSETYLDAIITGHMTFLEDKWPYTVSVHLEVVLDDPSLLTAEELHDLRRDGVSIYEVAMIDVDYIDAKRAEKYQKYQPPVSN
jgi:hypothetical protein